MKQEVRVAFILPSLANRGPIIFTRYLIEQLVKMISCVKVFYFDDIVEVDFPCDCEKINFRDKINFSDYDIVHSTMFRPDLYVIMNKRLMNKVKCKSVSGLHNYILEDMVFSYGKLKGIAISLLWMFFLKHFNSRVYSSRNMAEHYRDKIGSLDDVIIPYGISKVNYNADIHLPHQKEIIKLKERGYLIIGAVGLLIYRKGYHQLISALVELKEHALVLVGDGPEKENLKRQAEALGVAERVVFAGFYEHSSQYYQYIDIYCLCSYSEGFGLAMLEALSVRLPLVCSHLLIYDEYFSNENVAFFTPDKTDELVSAINLVTNNMVFYQASASKLFDKFFDSKIMAHKHVEHYLNCKRQDVH
ncbi:glycosyltransferase family 4 protein [Zobellella aerophila]|uniref:Glycosyl transferase family 1 domain-containing protein n=1 Tax=Zobellella aerophila TaxID=870480 RepID=A0ABP6VKK0_9GAMM